MVHDQRRKYAGPHCEGTRRFIVAKIGRSGGCWSRSAKGQIPQSLQGRSHAAEAAPIKRHTIQQVTSDDGLGETSIEERHSSVRRDGVPSAMYCNFGSERNVV